MNDLSIEANPEDTWSHASPDRIATFFANLAGDEMAQKFVRDVLDNSKPTPSSFAPPLNTLLPLPPRTQTTFTLEVLCGKVTRRLWQSSVVFHVREIHREIVVEQSGWLSREKALRHYQRTARRWLAKGWLLGQERPISRRKMLLRSALVSVNFPASFTEALEISKGPVGEFFLSDKRAELLSILGATS